MVFGPAVPIKFVDDPLKAKIYFISQYQWNWYNPEQSETIS